MGWRWAGGREPRFKAPPGSPPRLPWQFTLEPLTRLFSCFLLLSPPGPVSSLFSPFLSLPVPSPALFGLISMALISMECKYSNKHIRLNIGLCRKRRSVSRLLPAPGTIHADEVKGGRKVLTHVSTAEDIVGKRAVGLSF